MFFILFYLIESNIKFAFSKICLFIMVNSKLSNTTSFVIYQVIQHDMTYFSLDFIF